MNDNNDYNTIICNMVDLLILEKEKSFSNFYKDIRNDINYGIQRIPFSTNPRQ